MSWFLEVGCEVENASPSSQARVSGSASSDETSEEGEYESDFVDSNDSSDFTSCNFHLSREDCYFHGLPFKIRNHLPDNSYLETLVGFSDYSFSKKLQEMPPRKPRVPIKFQEKSRKRKKPFLLP